MWWEKHLPTISLVFCLGFCLLTFSQVLLGWPGATQWPAGPLRTSHVSLTGNGNKTSVCVQNKSSHWQGGILFLISWEPSLSADYLLALAVLGGRGVMSCICSAPPPPSPPSSQSRELHLHECLLRPVALELPVFLSGVGRKLLQVTWCIMDSNMWKSPKILKSETHGGFIGFFSWMSNCFIFSFEMY